MAYIESPILSIQRSPLIPPAFNRLIVRIIPKRYPFSISSKASSNELILVNRGSLCIFPFFFSFLGNLRNSFSWLLKKGGIGKGLFRPSHPAVHRTRARVGWWVGTRRMGAQAAGDSINLAFAFQVTGPRMREREREMIATKKRGST